MKKFVWTMVCGAIALCLALDSADARPKYSAAFLENYPDVKAAATVKCNVCHVNGQEKKVRNAYGMAVGTALGEKNVMDAAKIKAGLEKAAADNKEFGDRLKAGKLPVE